MTPMSPRSICCNTCTCMSIYLAHSYMLFFLLLQYLLPYWFFPIDSMTFFCIRFGLQARLLLLISPLHAVVESFSFWFLHLLINSGYTFHSHRSLLIKLWHWNMYFCFSFLIYYKIGFMQLKLGHTTFPPISSCRNWHPLSSHLVSCHGIGGNDFTNIFFSVDVQSESSPHWNTAWLLDTVLLITVSFANWRWVNFLLLMSIYLFPQLSCP